VHVKRIAELKDRRVKARLGTRFDQIRLGNFGDQSGKKTGKKTVIFSNNLLTYCL